MGPREASVPAMDVSPVARPIMPLSNSNPGMLPPPVFDPNAVYYDESGEQVSFEQYCAAYERQQDEIKRSQSLAATHGKSSAGLNTLHESRGEESDADSNFSPRTKASGLNLNKSSSGGGGGGDDDYETVESLVEEIERLKLENMRLTDANEDLTVQLSTQTSLKALDLLAVVNDTLAETNSEPQRQYQEWLKVAQHRALRIKNGGGAAGGIPASNSGPGSGGGSTGKSPRGNGRNPRDIAEISRLKIELDTRDKQLNKTRKHLDLARRENSALQKKLDDYGNAGQLTSMENEIVALKKTIKGYEHELQVMRNIQHQQENALLQRERRMASNTSADKPPKEDYYIPARGPLRLSTQTRRPMLPMGPMKPSQMGTLPSISHAAARAAAEAAGSSHIPYVKTGLHGDHVVPDGASGPW